MDNQKPPLKLVTKTPRQVPIVAPIDETQRKYTVFLRLDVVDCQRLEDGMWMIEVPAIPVSAETEKIIDQLFPLLGEQAYKLLNQEALLAALR